MKIVDPSIELVVCGSSHYYMPTFGEWERTVLRESYEYVDYLSLHQYYGNAENDTALFLSRSVDMDAFIKAVISICDSVKAERHSNKTINLSFDEWNIWFHSSDRVIEPWQVAPPLLEDIYNFEDALLFGCLLMTLLRNSHRVKIACLAQLVNVIAPIMTQTGGPAWAQTIFYPFMHMSAWGRGLALATVCGCDSYKRNDQTDIPFIETAAAYNEETAELTVFAVNRSQTDGYELSLDMAGFEGFSCVEHIAMEHSDLKAVNTAENPDNVVPKSKSVPADGKTFSLSPLSWNVLRFK